MQPNKKSFDSQLQAYFGAIKHAIKEEHLFYLQAHPELRQILNDFLSSCLLEQPADIYSYAKKYFAYFNYQKDIVTHKPFVISGFSGAGKGTVLTHLLTKFPTLFELSISYTTRRPRQGEVQGRQYYFVTKEQFEKEIAKEVFLEYAEVHGNYYGTHKGKMKDIMSRGKICLLDVDLKGGETIHSKANDVQCNFMFIDIPSLAVLEERLRARATESEEAIQKRLATARKEGEKIKELLFYEHLINDKLESFLEAVEKFIESHYKVTL